jgi:cysteinyl-tRNA synthetase
MDFVLWKPSTSEQPGWDSPWGRGRPGWHIECSAMAEALLGPEFDIHGGGIDLQFPHHENELAQSCCVHGTERMAQVWMHNGFLQVEGEKMAKSLGNFFTVKDLLDQGVPGEVIRFVLLSTHYRQPMDWTDKKMEEAERTLRRWRSMASDAEADATGGSVRAAIDAAVVRALADDLNTPQAVAELHRLAGEGDAATLRVSAAILGLLTRELAGWDTIEASAELAQLIEGLLADRQTARKSKDFARADAIRARLDAAGVVVMDRPNAPTDWELSPDFDPAKLEAPA